MGDAADYVKLLSLSKSDAPLSAAPYELVYGSTNGEEESEMADDMQICQCNDVSKAQVVSAIKDADYDISLSALKKCSKVCFLSIIQLSTADA